MADPTDDLVDLPDESEDEGKVLVQDEGTPDPKDETKAQDGDEGKAPAKAKAKDEPPPQRRDNSVPLATFLQEKGKFTKAIEDRDTAIADLKARLAKLENPEKPTPKYEEDPKGFIEHATKSAAKDVLSKLEETTKSLEEIKGGTKESRERQQQADFMNTLTGLEEAFVKSTPDYYEALGHIRQIAYAQIAEFNPELTHEQIVESIGKQELMMAARALDQGKNPHELAYRLAAINGYTKKAAKQAAKPNGKQPAKAPDLEEERLPPEDSLGASAGGGDDGADDEKDPFDAAFDERMAEFMGKRKAS